MPNLEMRAQIAQLESVTLNFRNLSRSWDLGQEVLYRMPHDQIIGGIEESTLDALDTLANNFKTCYTSLVNAGYPVGLTPLIWDLENATARLRAEIARGGLESNAGTRHIYDICSEPYNRAFGLFVAIQSLTMVAERDRLRLVRQVKQETERERAFTRRIMAN